MAPSGVDKGRVTADALIEVNADGNVTQGNGRASAETLMHLQIVERCQCGAVLHTHSANATVLSRQALHRGCIELEGWEMLKGLRGITTHETTIRVPVVDNNQDLEILCETAKPLLPEAPYGLLVAGHGLYAWGTTLKEARRHIEILEFLLNVHWKQQLLGIR
jgi:methylthioribulose-1-phosphate dehydratase